MPECQTTSETSTPYLYDAYGNLPAGQTGQPFLYTGRRWDNEAKLYYYRARYYSAELGRFLQTDPIGYEDNMNWYGYTGNDPVNKIDPTGKVKRDKDGKIIFTPKDKAYIRSPVTGRHLQVQDGYIEADDGTQVSAFQNLSDERGADCDCHGFTFADGEFWINNDQVDALLSGDSYQNVQGDDVGVGDIAVYRNEDGEVVHSATVAGVDRQSGQVSVRGLGGFETEPHTDPAEKGFFTASQLKEAGYNPKDGYTKIEYYRKPKE